MPTIMLNDDLMNQVVQAGNYQNPQEAVIAILSDYVLAHQTTKTLTNELHSDIDLTNEEIDSLFARHQYIDSKPEPKITKGDKTINPADLFGLWKEQPRNLNDIRKQAWQRSESE